MQLAEAFFGSDETRLDKGDLFLKKFILNRGWMDEDTVGEGSGRSFRQHSDEGGDSEDNESSSGSLEEDDHFLDEVDRYEAAYNFRWGFDNWCNGALLFNFSPVFQAILALY